MADSVLRDKAKEFAKSVVFLCRDMKSNHKEAVLINQLLRSATSIGANLHEAQYAQGTKDFISKLEIAQKECYETEYWLELLFETNCMAEENYKALQNDCGAIRSMLISSLKTIKTKNKGLGLAQIYICTYKCDVGSIRKEKKFSECNRAL